MPGGNIPISCKKEQAVISGPKIRAICNTSGHDFCSSLENRWDVTFLEESRSKYYRKWEISIAFEERWRQLAERSPRCNTAPVHSPGPSVGSLCSAGTKGPWETAEPPRQMLQEMEYLEGRRRRSESNGFCPLSPELAAAKCDVGRERTALSFIPPTKSN